jgi:CelD/BcsL family acetyltransferase involved in cellulose biosynthesis
VIMIRCVHDLAEAEPLREAINALNLAAARPDPFSTFEFYRNHLRNTALFAPGRQQLWLLLAFQDGELIGYLALKQVTHRVLGLRARKLDFLTGDTADRPHLVTRPEAAAAVGAAVYAYLLSRRREWSLLEFQQQDPMSELQPPAQAVSGACRCRQWPTLPNGTIALQWDSIAAYFAALSKKARSNVSRQMRSLLAAGEVQLLTSSDPQSTAALFELYRAIEPHSWKVHGGGAIGSDRQSLDYYTGLLAPGQPMQVWIQVLLLDGQPIAGLITGAFGHDLHALHIVYDERVARLAPGSAILLMGVRLAIGRGCRAFNLLRGFGYYKTRWLAQMSETCSVQVYRIGTPFHWRRVLGDLRRRWFGRWSGAAAAADAALFNPARREAEPGGAECPGAAGAPEIGAAERARYSELIAQARRGPGEFLSAAQLAAVLPFETARSDAVRPLPAVPPRGNPDPTGVDSGRCHRQLRAGPQSAL